MRLWAFVIVWKRHKGVSSCTSGWQWQTAWRLTNWLNMRSWKLTTSRLLLLEGLRCQISGDQDVVQIFKKQKILLSSRLFGRRDFGTGWLSEDSRDHLVGFGHSPVSLLGTCDVAVRVRNGYQGWKNSLRSCSWQLNSRISFRTATDTAHLPTMSYVVADCDRSRAKTQACPIRQKKPVGVVLCSTGVVLCNTE